MEKEKGEILHQLVKRSGRSDSDQPKRKNSHFLGEGKDFVHA